MERRMPWTLQTRIAGRNRVGASRHTRAVARGFPRIRFQDAPRNDSIQYLPDASPWRALRTRVKSRAPARRRSLAPTNATRPMRSWPVRRRERARSPDPGTHRLQPGRPKCEGPRAGDPRQSDGPERGPPRTMSRDACSWQRPERSTRQRDAPRETMKRDERSEQTNRARTGRTRPRPRLLLANTTSAPAAPSLRNPPRRLRIATTPTRPRMRGRESTPNPWPARRPNGRSERGPTPTGSRSPTHTHRCRRANVPPTGRA